MMFLKSLNFVGNLMVQSNIHGCTPSPSELRQALNFSMVFSLELIPHSLAISSLPAKQAPVPWQAANNCMEMCA